METKDLNILLIILLLCAAGYLAYGKYEAYTNTTEKNIREEGRLLGIQQAVLTIVEQVAQCKQVPLIIGNQTINVVAIDCIQAPTSTNNS